MAYPAEDVFFASIAELGAKLKSLEISALDLTNGFCDRLERYGPRYNALALSLREHAVREAREVDKELKRGRYRGPLHGIPFAAKDLLSVANQITTWGAKPYAAQVFDYDATVIQKLRKAGAILIGKLSMVELAGGGGYNTASASLFGPGLNPWDRTRWSGGSSSGSGSAVAAGLVPFALGSETSGSILTPSAFCGVTGLRPTFGLVSRFGAMPLSWTLDKIGPMCRTAEDCGLVLRVIAGADNKDPASAGKNFYYAPQFTREMKDIRVGYSPVDFNEWAAPATREAFQKALETIRSIGVQVVETKLPDLPYEAVTGTIISADAASSFENLILSGQVNELADKRQIAGLKAAMDIPARDYLKAMRIRRIIQQQLRGVLTDLDMILAPARYELAPKINEPFDRSLGLGDRPQPSAPGMRSLIPAGNLAGLPAISLPCGQVDNLPVALSLVSRPFTENMLLSVGNEFQKRTDWNRRRPNVS
jgi:aspartyl-tRNA(Asn)/glutamyl-tRNA(Gln) amidotransferase subunit A